MGSKWPKNTCLSIPSGLGTNLERMIFFALGTLVDPPLAPTVLGLAGPPAAPSDHWYGGLRVSLGHSKGWKPQNVGGCGWTRCPRNSFLSHVAQDAARSWFRGAGAHCAVFWGFLAPFWAVSRTYCGVRGRQRSLGHEKVEPHVECSSCLPSFGCFEPLLGLFWAKNGCFWPKTAQIWEGTSRPGAPAPGRQR